MWKPPFWNDVNRHRIDPSIRFRLLLLALNIVCDSQCLVVLHCSTILRQVRYANLLYLSRPCELHARFCCSVQRIRTLADRDWLSRARSWLTCHNGTCRACLLSSGGSQPRWRGDFEFGPRREEEPGFRSSSGTTSAIPRARVGRASSAMTQPVHSESNSLQIAERTNHEMRRTCRHGTLHWHIAIDLLVSPAKNEH